MRRKYWWEEWFARPTTVLVRGIDYNCSQSAMVQIIRNNASARGVSVHVTDHSDGMKITIRVLGERASDAVQHTDAPTVAE